MDLGQFGVWQVYGPAAGAAEEIEALGFGALWLGGSPSPVQLRRFLERTSSLTVASGIVNVWHHPARRVAVEQAELVLAFGDRALLGVGIGHSESVDGYKRPLATMTSYFDELDAATQTVGRERRITAALGPKMLDLAADRSLGTHPYFTTPEHTKFARDRLGKGPIVAPELAVVLEEDDETARRVAREYADRYLSRRNYVNNLLRFDFTEGDVRDGGSDRLIDAVVPHGSAGRIAEAAHAHLDAGADHVCLQVLSHERPPVDAYRVIAQALR